MFTRLSIAPLAATLLLSMTACKTTSTVDPTTGLTNTVKTVDPVRLTQIRDIIEPGAASVLRRTIQRSPQHAQEIKDYAGAVSSIFCQMQQSGNFSVDSLIAAADKATSRLQSNASGNADWTADLVDAKGVLIGVYKAAAADDLTWKLPDNVWLQQISALICNAITQALAGQ